MLPVETIRACCPAYGLPPGAIRLRAPTLAHAVALEALGVDLDGALSDKDGLFAAFVLTLDPAVARLFACDEVAAREAYGAWLDKLPPDIRPPSVARQVTETLAASFASAIEPKHEENETGRCVNKHGRSGLGWPLELAEWYAHEYRRGLDEALGEPIARVFACIACARQRNGGKHGGPDYWERIDMKAALAELERDKEA